jgi:hypothetical protein
VFVNRLDSTEGFGLWLRRAGAETLARHLFLFSPARLARARFIPSRHYSSAGLFACHLARFDLAPPGFTTKTAKNLRGTIQFFIHRLNIRQAVVVFKRKMKLFSVDKEALLRDFNPATGLH